MEPRGAHGRTASLVATCDQWVRATHHSTAVDGLDGELMLSWTDAPAVAPPEGEICIARGLATDRLCRVYRLRADGIDRLLVGPTEFGIDYGTLPEPVTVIGSPPQPDDLTPPCSGPDFGHAVTRPLEDAVGLAVDDADRLFVADRARRSISVIDLWSHRLLRTIGVATPTHPERFPMGLAQDRAEHGTSIWAVVRQPHGLLRLTATRGPVEVALPGGAQDLPPDAQPSRVAVLAGGEPAILFHDSAGQGWLVAGSRPPRNVGPASDIITDGEGAIVVAPCPSVDGRATLRRFAPISDGWTRATPMNADGYDGNGLVLTKDCRIGYFTEDGFRLAVVGAVDYQTEGYCISYRLDSGVPLNRWGRVLVEACVPDGTKCLVGTVSTDEDYMTEIAHVEAEPAACVAATPDATPPLPPELLEPDPAESTGPLHSRRDATTPWWYGDDTYQMHEAPVFAPPGRYLWVTVRLVGNRRRTPRVRELRVEHQGHTLLRRLPNVFAAEEERAEFLHRYLAPFDGLLHDLELRSRCRDILLDPLAAPGEALDWLASFFGLALDSRWAEPARRQLIAEIVPLYRTRGTVGALARYIQIFLAGERANDPQHVEVTPVIVEHFRLRGLGGPLLGDDPVVSTRSVLGHGFRVGGAVGDLETRPLDPEEDSASPFTSTAHRFTVLIPQPIGAEEDAAIRHILDTERPAHTMYELCTVDAGMRVGRGLHLGLSSIVGPTGAFDSAIADLALLGRGTILGGPTTGIAVEAGRLGANTRVG